MKASEAIAAADELVPNPFSEAQKLRWLNQIEFRVRVDAMLEDPETVTPISEQEEDTADLTLEDRYQEVYISWMKSMYYWHMGEYDVYQNEKAMFEAEWLRFERDLCEALHVGTGGSEH